MDRNYQVDLIIAFFRMERVSVENAYSLSLLGNQITLGRNTETARVFHIA